MRHLLIAVALGKPVIVDNRPGASNTLGAALASPDLAKRFADMGLVAKHSTPDEFGRFLQSEITRWRAVLARKP